MKGTQLQRFLGEESQRDTPPQIHPAEIKKQEKKTKSQMPPVSAQGPAVAGRGYHPDTGSKQPENNTKQPSVSEAQKAPAAISAGQSPAEATPKSKEQQKDSSDLSPQKTAQLTAYVYNARWASFRDCDGDGFRSQERLEWDVDVNVFSCMDRDSLQVFEKIYWKYSDSSMWHPLQNYFPTVHTIRGCDIEWQYADIDGGGHNEYDWRIEVFQYLQTVPDDVYDHTDDWDLWLNQLETAEQDSCPKPIICCTYWSNTTDCDNDTYRSRARLNWEPNVSNCNGSFFVFERIYWKRPGLAWALIDSTSPHQISNCLSDNYYEDFFGGAHSYYDWKIEIYQVGKNAPDDSALALNFPMELVSEDPCPGSRATLWDARWFIRGDCDGDRCADTARLVWDPDVLGGVGSLQVFERVYQKPVGYLDWIYFDQTPLHIINGNSEADTQYVDIEVRTTDGVTPCQQFDWKIEVWRLNQPAADDTLLPGDDTDLALKNLERPQDDPCLKPDIRCYPWAVANFDTFVIVSALPGDHVESPVRAGQAAYIDWAAHNYGPGPTRSSSVSRLLIGLASFSLTPR